MKRRSDDTTMLDMTRTKSVASPIAKAFKAVLETASTGHIPSTCTNTGLSRQTPLMNSSYDSFLLTVVLRLRHQAVVRHPLVAVDLPIRDAFR